MKSSVIGVVGMLAMLPLIGSASAAAAAHAQQRQLAVTTLSNFEVVLTATRSPGTGSAPAATVTAAGFRHTSGGWQLIATKRIGKANGWSWFATQVCSLTVRQFKPEPSSAKNLDAVRVSLLWGPAIGCLGPYTERWQP
jgi:invasion protein IalB